jgi:hypothetical protein
MDSVQAQQLNQVLNQVHDNHKNQNLVCKLTTIEALMKYLGLQGASVPTAITGAKNANEAVKKMNELTKEFTPVSAKEAMKWAGQGGIVIAGSQGKDYGHIDVVGAGPSQPSGSLDGRNPISIGNSQDALSRSWEDGGMISRSFGFEPTYYQYTGFTPRGSESTQPTLMTKIEDAVKIILIMNARP